MKKLKLLLITAFFTLTFNAISQTKEIVYIRIQENITVGGSASPDSYMSIIYPDQPTKYIELARLGKSGKAAEENGKKIQLEITQLINTGYEITSCSVGADINMSTTLMILTRKKEK